jgi:integral membrane sensor domain MASE1
MTQRLTAAPWFRTIGLFVLVFLGYAVGAVVSLKAFGASELGPAFFPSAGITAAAMISTRRSRWPAVVAAIILAEFLVDLYAGNAPGAIAGYALANAMEPLIGATLALAWCGAVPDLRRRRDLLLFVAGACLMGPLCGALIGGSTVAWHLGAWWPGSVLRWFASDAIGVLVVAAPILLWPKQSHILRERPVETVGILGTIAALSWLAVWTGLPPSLLILPVLAWAALRLDVLGAALAGAAVAFAANLRAASGLSLFADLDLSAAGKLAVVQALIAANVLLAMLIAQEGASRWESARERAFQEQERLRLQALSRLAQQLSAALTPQDVGRVLERQLIHAVGATGVNVGLLTSDGLRLEWAAVTGSPAPVFAEFGGQLALTDRCAATDAARTGEPVLIRTVDEYRRRYAAMSDWLATSGVASVAAWPLSQGATVVGSLSLAWSTPQPLNDVQQAYIAAMATMATQALVRSKFYSDEHARAAVLHSAAHPSTRVDAAGLDYRTLYQPAEVSNGLGGDWYSVVSLPNGRTYLAVGDVIGHGLTAVEDMAQLRSAAIAYAYQGLRPAQVLTELNRFAGNVIRGEFATNLVAIFDHHAGSLTYSSAGHPPALLRRAETGTVIRLTDARGPVLGPFADASFSDGTKLISPGDILFMYTDGLIEHEGSNVEAGIAKLERAIASRTPEAVLDCDALADELAPSPHPDDLCMLVVRFGTNRPQASDAPQS